ncbi:MAG: helix-turn-helix domain-containing protein [bacterium]
MKKFFTPTEVAELLGVSIPTIRKILKKKEIRYIQLARKILIEPEEITKFINTKRK